MELDVMVFVGLFLVMWLAVLLLLVYSCSSAYDYYKKVLAEWSPKLGQAIEENERRVDDQTWVEDVSNPMGDLPMHLWPLPILHKVSDEKVTEAAAKHDRLVYFTWAWFALLAILYWLREDILM